MTALVTAEALGQRPSPGPGLALCAEPGDTLVIDSAGIPGIPRTGTIVAVTGLDGSPPYLVRWTTGDFESRISPSPGARIERCSASPKTNVAAVAAAVGPAVLRGHFDAGTMTP